MADDTIDKLEEFPDNWDYLIKNAVDEYKKQIFLIENIERDLASHQGVHLEFAENLALKRRENASIEREISALMEEIELNQSNSNKLRLQISSLIEEEQNLHKTKSNFEAELDLGYYRNRMRKFNERELELNADKHSSVQKCKELEAELKRITEKVRRVQSGEMTINLVNQSEFKQQLDVLEDKIAKKENGIKTMQTKIRNLESEIHFCEKRFAAQKLRLRRQLLCKQAHLESLKDEEISVMHHN